MAHTYLIFDFGVDEETAQKARHRIEGWKQAFKLDRKMLVRFEREAPEHAEAPKVEAKPNAKSKKSAGAPEPEPARVRLFVRLDFSEHEKLSHQRWLDRIPTEEPFKAAKPEIVSAANADFESTAKRFETLEAQASPTHSR
jgi:hypothetical protein